MMAELDEVERYRKLLDDWKPGPPAKQKSSLKTMPAAPSTAYTPKPATPEKYSRVEAAFTAPGTILRLNGRTLAVYKKAVPEKDYHLVLILGPAGSVKAQGVALEGYDVEELGSIAPKWFDKLQNEMRWDRDLIVFHCYSYEDAQKVPRFESPEPARDERSVPEPTPDETGPAAPPPQAAAPPPPRPDQLNGNLRRGQRLQIKFGSNMWDAVYWGKDDQGQVIAHKTYETWALMHLDLKRFAHSMLVDPETDQNLVQEIEQSLLKP